MKTETPGFYPAARGVWEPNWGVIEKYISFVYKLKQPKALCCCSRNGLGKQVILLGLTQEPHLKNYRFSVTWYGDHHTRRGKLTGWPDSLDLSEDDLLNPRVGYPIQYGRHRGQGVPSRFLAPTSAIQTQCWGGGWLLGIFGCRMAMCVMWPSLEKCLKHRLTFGLFSSLLWSSVWVEEVRHLLQMRKAAAGKVKGTHSANCWHSRAESPPLASFFISFPCNNSLPFGVPCSRV